ncbi:hypothetical protein Mapa_011859 [Marchantia paleacea]|nr:hypothetical protein Mapa_011859 [Marchantia paleacea]
MFQYTSLDSNLRVKLPYLLKSDKYFRLFCMSQLKNLHKDYVITSKAYGFMHLLVIHKNKVDSLVDAPIGFQCCRHSMWLTDLFV